MAPNQNVNFTVRNKLPSDDDNNAADILVEQENLLIDNELSESQEEDKIEDESENHAAEF